MNWRFSSDRLGIHLSLRSESVDSPEPVEDRRAEPGDDAWIEMVSDRPGVPDRPGGRIRA